MAEYPEFDFEVAEDFSNAREVICKLRPKWKWEDVKIKPLTAGITNKIVSFRLQSDQEQADMILIRRYGENTDLIIDRRAEKRNMKLMHSIGCGGALYASLNNGVVYEFLPGNTTNENTVRDLRRPIAEQMARMHSIDISCNPDFDTSSPALFKTLDKFMSEVPERLSNPDKQKQWESYSLGTKEDLAVEVDLMKNIIKNHAKSPLGLTHNDLLLANIVYDKKTQRLSFIDFEYGAYSYLFFDIGNHFDEYAGVETVDYSRFPDREYQREWLNIYFDAMKRHKPSEELSSLTDDMEAVLDEVNMFALCANLFWGVWALVQAEYSSIDFDYVEYAFQRLGEYYHRKQEFLAPFSK